MFLPFPALRDRLLKGKKHHPSSRDGVHSLRQQNNNARGKASIVDFSALFSAEAEFRFLGFIPPGRRPYPPGRRLQPVK